MCQREGDDDKLSLVRSDCELKAQILTVKTRRATCTHLWHQLPRLRSPAFLSLLFCCYLTPSCPRILHHAHTLTQREKRERRQATPRRVVQTMTEYLVGRGNSTRVLSTVNRQKTLIKFSPFSGVIWLVKSTNTHACMSICAANPH